MLLKTYLYIINSIFIFISRITPISTCHLCIVRPRGNQTCQAPWTLLRGPPRCSPPTPNLTTPESPCWGLWGEGESQEGESEECQGSLGKFWLNTKYTYTLSFYPLLVTSIQDIVWFSKKWLYTYSYLRRISLWAGFQHYRFNIITKQADTDLTIVLFIICYLS